MPALATDVGACREAVCPDTGRIVQSGDVDGFASALLVLPRANQAATPRRFVLDKGDARVMHRSYQALYR